MKKEYIDPELEIILLQNADIITSSDEGDGTGSGTESDNGEGTVG